MHIRVCNNSLRKNMFQYHFFLMPNEQYYVGYLSERGRQKRNETRTTTKTTSKHTNIQTDNVRSEFID